MLFYNNVFINTETIAIIQFVSISRYIKDTEKDSDGSYELTIQNLTLNDQGRYKCKAVSFAGDTYSEDGYLFMQSKYN